MRHAIIVSLVLVCSLGLWCCDGQKKRETDSFTFYFHEADAAVMNAIIDAATSHAQAVFRKFDSSPGDVGKISVFVFPDQKAYDRHVPSEALASSPACSFGSTIMMVSPTSPIRIPGLPFGERVSMVVHELVHIVINHENPGIPSWLDEGVASFEGSPDHYRSISRFVLERADVPSLERLIHGTEAVPGADAFAAMFVAWVVDEFGYGSLNGVIRNPDHLESILGKTVLELEKEWKGYILELYGNGS